MNRGRFPRAPVPGDVSYYIQRGATLQTYRALAGPTLNRTPAAVAQPIDTLIACPFVVGLAADLDQLAINCTVLAAGSSVRVGIYRATSSRDIYPGALVISPAAFVTTSVGFKANAAVATLSPGLYWAVSNSGVLAPTLSALSVGANTAHDHHILGWTGANPPTTLNSLRVAFAFAAMPDPFPAAAALNAGASTMIFGRFSA